MAKPLDAPFYLMRGGEVSLKLLNSENKVVYEKTLNADRGLNFIRWDLRTGEDNFTEPGDYNLQLTGANFVEEKKFRVTKFSRQEME